MDDKIKVGEFVVCNTNQGIPIEKNRVSEPDIGISTHFDYGAVGIVEKIYETNSEVYLIGKDQCYRIPNDHLAPLDPTKTGKGYDKKSVTCATFSSRIRNLKSTKLMQRDAKHHGQVVGNAAKASTKNP